MTLSVDEARDLAAKWRPQFQDEANFEHSWSRFFEMVGEPDATRLEFWLAKDQAATPVEIQISRRLADVRLELRPTATAG